MTIPKVSILVPTYNFARFLPETIDSILEQDFRDFELLISDDCSTDDSAGVIAGYAARDSRIRFQIHPANLGMVQNWNWCLSQARGEYIKFVFGDDKLAGPQALAKLVGLLETNASASLAVSARNIIDENSKVGDVWDHLGPPGLYPGRKVIEKCWELISCNLIGEPTAVLFRKRDATRGFDIRYRQIVDLEMWFHLLEKGDLIHTSEALCCFRRHEQQQTKVNNNGNFSERECMRFFIAYGHKTYKDPRFYKEMLYQLYLFKERCKKDWRQDVELRQVEREMLDELGKFRHAIYRLHLIMTRPTWSHILFERLYYLKKSLKKNRGQDAELLQAERKQLEEFGKFRYAAYWLHRKITRPLSSLSRSIRKQLPGL